jgi:hypothetical protein
MGNKALLQILGHRLETLTETGMKIGLDRPPILIDKDGPGIVEESRLLQKMTKTVYESIAVRSLDFEMSELFKQPGKVCQADLSVQGSNLPWMRYS